MEKQSSDVALKDALDNVRCPTQFPAALRDSKLSSPIPCVPCSVLTSESRIVDRQSYHHVTDFNLVERLGCGYVVVDRYRRIVEANAAAQRLLDRTDGIGSDTSSGSQCVLRQLLDRGGIGLEPGSLIWVATSSKRDVTIALKYTNDFTMDRTVVVVLLDLDTFPAPNPTTLKRLFGLTFAEARLAFHLAQGRTPSEIAKILRVSRATIGAQLGAIFSKTNTKRQATLVALLSRIAILP
jgi:DNA-binding CsgD family transcriptional regulator